MNKTARTNAAVVSDATIIALINRFIDIYGYAPDKIDIARRCNYHPKALHRRLLRMEQCGLVKRNLDDKMARGKSSTWQVVEGA